jgi:hypothetical protein
MIAMNFGNAARVSPMSTEASNGRRWLGPLQSRAPWVAGGLIAQLLGMGSVAAALWRNIRHQPISGHITAEIFKLAWHSELHTRSGPDRADRWLGRARGRQRADGPAVRIQPGCAVHRGPDRGGGRNARARGAGLRRVGAVALGGGRRRYSPPRLRWRPQEKDQEVGSGAVGIFRELPDDPVVGHPARPAGLPRQLRYFRASLIQRRISHSWLTRPTTPIPRKPRPKP